MTTNLIHGDCLRAMRAMPDNSVDSIVADPPYGLSFMGKRWDYDVPSVEIWAECLRVLKPGGHLLAFAGTRTQHRMAVRIEDAGFEIRDMIAWVYGQGFPKSHNLDGDWRGWGTALKPALEPITVARKPLIGTVAENVAAHSTGAMNVEACRVDGENRTLIQKMENCHKGAWNSGAFSHSGTSAGTTNLGRWPANLIHDGSDEVVGLFPQTTSHGGGKATYGGAFGNGKEVSDKTAMQRFAGDSGSAARFFYCAKASKRDRDEGCEGLEVMEATNRHAFSGLPDQCMEREQERRGARNHHPTVKPTDLMRYLCRLVTPPGGIVLDPFMGSGSTGKAAILEGFHFIGIERDEAYFQIAKTRIEKSKS